MSAVIKSALIQHQFTASYKEIIPSFPTHANTHLACEKVNEQRNSQTSEKREITRRKPTLRGEGRLAMLKKQLGRHNKEKGW